MQDKQFGNMRWEDDKWSATVSVPYFNSFATADDGGTWLDAPCNGRNSALPTRDRQIQLYIDIGDRRKAPSSPQRAVWAAIAERGDKLWEEIERLAFSEYQLQRERRMKWWNVTYGPEGTDRVFPKLANAEGMRELYFPALIHIERPATKDNPVHVGVQFASKWYSDGIGVLIRDGEIVRLGGGWIGVPRLTKPPVGELTHPLFGLLRRERNEGPWSGTVRIDEFLDFASVAADRLNHLAMPERFPPKSNLDWDFARGEFLLNIYAKPGDPPSEAQAAALACWRKSPREHADAVLAAILAKYIETRDERLRNYRGIDPEKALPPVREVRELTERIQLMEVAIYPDEPSRASEINLGFNGLRGFGVRWRDGAVDEVGPEQIGRPPEPAAKR